MEDILEQILEGKQTTQEIKTNRGNFVIVYALPRDLRNIEIEIARRMGGQPESSFTPVQITNFRAYATLDYIITKAPDWWDKLESAEDCPDDELIIQLYRGFLQFQKKIQKEISRSRFGRASGRSGANNKNEVVGD